MFLFFLFSFFLHAELEKSTSTYITHSLYDLNYLESILEIFSNNCEISKSSETLSLLISLKKLGYTRSDVYSVMLCSCENDIKLDELKFLISNKKPFNLLKEFFEKNKCDYSLFKKRSFDYLSERRDFYFRSDLELLNKIIEKYFK